MSKEATTVTVMSGYGGEQSAAIKINSLVKGMLPRPQTGGRTTYIVTVEILDVS